MKSMIIYLKLLKGHICQRPCFGPPLNKIQKAETWGLKIYIHANTKHYHLVQNYKSRPKIEIQRKENLGQDNISLTPYEWPLESE